MDDIAEPDEWIPVPKAPETEETDDVFVNDEGIRYLIGRDNEYLAIHGDIPENTC